MANNRIRPSRETIGERSRTHGQTGSLTYTSWAMMVQRCCNPNFPAYQEYGKVGIKVCRRWRKFENFLADMGERPSRAHTLDRFPKPKRGYRPGNCRWATRSQQALNRRTTRAVVRGDGRRFPSLKEAADYINGNRRCIRDCCTGRQLTHYGQTYRYAK